MGISAALRDVPPEAFHRAVGPAVAARLLPDPCRVAA